jgi:hypothetical protein
MAKLLIVRSIVKNAYNTKDYAIIIIRILGIDIKIRELAEVVVT